MKTPKMDNVESISIVLHIIELRRHVNNVLVIKPYLPEIMLDVGSLIVEKAVGIRRSRNLKNTVKCARARTSCTYE
jgi:hypothetical protein